MELEKLSALELGSLVNRRQISPVEVIEYFKSRVYSRNNPKLNAFTYLKFDEAEAVAKGMEQGIMKGIHYGPFAGVPIALKDFLPSKKGWTHSHGGVKSIANNVDEVSSPFTEACESLGAIAIGKTNAPAFGFRGVTDNHMYGPTATPFNEDYNSGGSSGGSAAAVGAGLVAMAEAGDAGGSIRCPAAWCGCFGFKPSAGIVPSVCRPDAWAATHPYCCGGPITRTVDDAAVVLQQMIRYNPADPISIPIPHNLDDLRRVRPGDINFMKGMKIALTYDFDLFPFPDEQIAEKLSEVAVHLRRLGAEVDPVTFDFHYSREEMEHAWLRSICVDTAIDMELWKAQGIVIPDDEVPVEFVKWNKIALESSMMDYRKFHDIRTDILDAHNKIFANYDIILAPVTGCMPVPNNLKSADGLVQGPQEISGKKVDPLIGFCDTYLENMIGTPAASVPAGLGENNLPIGIQIIGRRYHDDDVLRVAYYLERVNPWIDDYKHSF